MRQKALEGLAFISREIGVRPDYTQGGGSNTSVKLDDEYMAIKASGFKLRQVNELEGYVVVNYKNICSYFSSTGI